MGYVLAIAIVGLELPLIGSVRQRDVEKAEERAVGHARASAAVAASQGLMGPDASRRLRALTQSAVRELQRDFGRDRLARVIVVDARGVLLADSGDPLASQRKTRLRRDEITAALNGRVAQARRNSTDLGAEIEVTAFPVRGGGGQLGAVRITQSAAAIDRTIGNDWLRALGIGLLVVAPLGLGAAIVLARRIAKPLKDLEAAAAMVSAGDLSARTPVGGSKEQQIVARAFNDMTAQLESLLRAQHAFVANASHQLRTPLTGIRLRLELLQARLRDDPAGARHSTAALEEVDRLARIVEELLVLSRAGESGEAAELIGLADVANGLIERWRASAESAGIGLQLRVEGEPGAARCARADVDRVLDVLVENALAYSPQGTTVTVVARRGSLAVLDEGPGLDPDETEAVFDRFFRGRASREGAPGTGLGLAIARELAVRWGGSAELSNREEGGARAEITLPPTENSAPAGDFTMA